MNSPHFLFRIYYTICGTESQEALEKFFENYREGVEVENAVVTAGGFCAARRVVASYRDCAWSGYIENGFDSLPQSASLTAPSSEGARPV